MTVRNGMGLMSVMPMRAVVRLMLSGSSQMWRFTSAVIASSSMMDP